MKILIIILITLSIKQCNVKSNNNTKPSISAKERDSQLINNYHKQMVIERGKDDLFIPKESVEWMYDKSQFITDTKLAKSGYNVSFFDTLGNVRYQALVKENVNGIIKIECQDLTTADYYITILNIDSIKDLDHNYPYKVIISPPRKR